MQYYTIGRYSVLAGVNPVAGNLLHHAIEMFLKGALAVNAASSPSEVEGKIKGIKVHSMGSIIFGRNLRKHFAAKSWQTTIMLLPSLRLSKTSDNRPGGSRK